VTTTDDGVLVHFLDDGFTYHVCDSESSIVARRGTQLLVTDSVRRANMLDAETSAFDLTPDEQAARYQGRVFFALGPLPGSLLDDGNNVVHEARTQIEAYERALEAPEDSPERAVALKRFRRTYKVDAPSRLTQRVAAGELAPGDIRRDDSRATYLGR